MLNVFYIAVLEAADLGQYHEPHHVPPLPAITYQEYVDLSMEEIIELAKHNETTARRIVRFMAHTIGIQTNKLGM